MQGEGWQGATHLYVSEIVDEKSFKAWLEALPEERRYEWAVTLATRAALRVFPMWVGVLPDDWARKSGLTVLPLSRSILISVAAAKMSAASFKQAADSSTSTTAFAGFTAFSAGSDASGSARAARAAHASKTAADAASEADGHATGYASKSVAAADGGYSWGVLRGDIPELEQAVDLRARPLWPEDMPANMAEAWATGRTWMETAPGHAFWIRWYEAILAGKPLTQDWDSHWQLMHDIALIPDEEWGEGKEEDAIRVEGIIDLITQKHALQHEVARAKRALENEVFNAMTLGQHRDNLPDDMPPSRIVEYRTALKELQIELDAVEETLQPPVPDAEVLEQATGRLRAVWEKIKNYPVAFAFVTLIGAAATGAATTAGSRGMDWLLDHGMPQLIRGLKDTAPKPSTPPKASKGWNKPSVDI